MINAYHYSVRCDCGSEFIQRRALIYSQRACPVCSEQAVKKRFHFRALTTIEPPKKGTMARRLYNLIMSNRRFITEGSSDPEALLRCHQEAMEQVSIASVSGKWEEEMQWWQPVRNRQSRNQSVTALCMTQGDDRIEKTRKGKLCI